MATLLTGYTALVTGGAGGIGRAISLELAAAGATVQILGRNKEKGQSTIDEISATGGSAHFHVIDLSEQTGLEYRIAELVHKTGTLDILVNNAGISGFTGPLADTPESALMDVIAVNAVAPLILSKRCIPGMKKSGYGRIINISSVAARVNPPNSVTYNMSKAAMNSLTRSLSREVAEFGITVNALAPGLVLTERIRKVRVPDLAKASNRTPDEVLAGMTARTDSGKLTSEAELAGTVLFLCSESAGNITGEIIEMSGGY